jgi:hypothetical protein
MHKRLHASSGNSSTEDPLTEQFLSAVLGFVDGVRLRVYRQFCSCDFSFSAPGIPAPAQTF